MKSYTNTYGETFRVGDVGNRIVIGEMPMSVKITKFSASGKNMFAEDDYGNEYSFSTKDRRERKSLNFIQFGDTFGISGNVVSMLNSNDTVMNTGDKFRRFKDRREDLSDLVIIVGFSDSGKNVLTQAPNEEIQSFSIKTGEERKPGNDLLSLRFYLEDQSLPLKNSESPSPSPKPTPKPSPTKKFQKGDEVRIKSWAIDDFRRERPDFKNVSNPVFTVTQAEPKNGYISARRIGKLYDLLESNVELLSAPEPKPSPKPKSVVYLSDIVVVGSSVAALKNSHFSKVAGWEGFLAAFKDALPKKRPGLSAYLVFKWENGFKTQQISFRIDSDDKKLIRDLATGEAMMEYVKNQVEPAVEVPPESDFTLSWEYRDKLPKPSADNLDDWLSQNSKKITDWKGENSPEMDTAFDNVIDALRNLDKEDKVINGYTFNQWAAEVAKEFVKKYPNMESEKMLTEEVIKGEGSGVMKLSWENKVDPKTGVKLLIINNIKRGERMTQTFIQWREWLAEALRTDDIVSYGENEERQRVIQYQEIDKPYGDLVFDNFVNNSTILETVSAIKILKKYG